MTSKEYIDSGILEQYVLGTASHSEREEVEKMAAADPVMRQEIDAICKNLENYAMSHYIEPNPLIKPLLMASIDYSERIKNGEPVSTPPLLHEYSTTEDYASWLNRIDMISPAMDDIFAKIIGYTPKVTTAIVWIKNYAPQEVHDKEYERFLIVEGNCDIIVGDKTNHLVPGDYFAIPLYEYHMVKVTSSIACKVILQRVAS